MVRLEPEELTRPPEEGARLVALRFLEDATAALGRVSAGERPDALHEFRVNLRRLRSTLQAFEPHLEPRPTEQAQARLRELGSRSNAARDAEVQIAWLESRRGELSPSHRPALRWLMQDLAVRRDQAQAKLLEKLPERFARLRADLVEVARRLPHLGAPGFARSVSDLRRGGGGETARAGGAAAREPGRDLLVFRQQRVSRSADRGQATALSARARRPLRARGQARRALAQGPPGRARRDARPPDPDADARGRRRTHRAGADARAARRRAPGRRARAGRRSPAQPGGRAARDRDPGARPRPQALRRARVRLARAALREVLRDPGGRRARPRRDPARAARDRAQVPALERSRDRARSPQPADRAGVDGGRVDPGAAAPRQRRLRRALLSDHQAGQRPDAGGVRGVDQPRDVRAALAADQGLPDREAAHPDPRRRAAPGRSTSSRAATW